MTKKLVNVTVGSETMELEFNADAPQDWIDECVRAVQREMRERQMRVSKFGDRTIGECLNALEAAREAKKAQVPA